MIPSSSTVKTYNTESGFSVFVLLRRGRGFRDRSVCKQHCVASTCLARPLQQRASTEVRSDVLRFIPWGAGRISDC